ncbi:MFS transporter [Nocardia niigatensis]
MTETITPGRKWGTVAIACLAMLLIALDMTVLHLAVPKLTETLKPTATQFLWIVDIYGFLLAGFLITMGNLGDRIGRKKLLLIGATVFGLASVAIAFAPNPAWLIAARALLGIAGATFMPSTLSLIRNVFDEPKERTAAIGIYSSVGLIGYVVGPLVGGVLLSNFWWGSVFLINVPVVAVIIAVGIAVVPESRNPAPGKLDPASVLLSIIGVLGIVYAISEVSDKGIGHLDVAVAAVFGVVGLALFLYRQTRLATPLIDVGLFRQRAYSATIAATVVTMFASLSVSLLLAQYLQLVTGWSPLKAGLAQLPGLPALVAGPMLVAPLVARLGRAATIAIGLALLATGFALYAQVDVHVNYPYLLLPMLVFGTGLPMTLVVCTDTVLATVPRTQAGAASGIASTAQELGGALGIAVIGTVLSVVYRSNLTLPSDLPAGAEKPIRDNLGAALSTAAQLPPKVSRPVIDGARQAFVDGIHLTMYWSAGVIAVLAVCMLYLLRGVPKVIEDIEGQAEQSVVEAPHAGI